MLDIGCSVIQVEVERIALCRIALFILIAFVLKVLGSLSESILSRDTVEFDI